MEAKQAEYYQVRDNWNGHGYRLYFGDDRFVTQVHGEINGIVFATVMGAQAYCLINFGEKAVRAHD